MAPAFAGNEFIKTASEEQITEVILKGREGAKKALDRAVALNPKLSGQAAKDPDLERLRP